MISDEIKYLHKHIDIALLDAQKNIGYYLRDYYLVKADRLTQKLAHITGFHDGCEKYP